MRATYTYYAVGGKTGALVFSPRGLIRLLLPSSKECTSRWIRNNYPGAKYSKDQAQALMRQLQKYFQGNQASFDVNFDLSECSPFQKLIYRELIKVPFGNTRSYKELAEAVGLRGGARAVGTALKNNPIPIIIPCHRIIKSDGSLGGFNSGVEWKKRLLRLEGIKIGRGGGLR